MTMTLVDKTPEPVSLPRAIESLLPGATFNAEAQGRIAERAGRLDEVIEAVNGAGDGLTLGIHSRINSTVRYIQRRLRVGNTYVNRNMIGAVVGVQPFGGGGLCGTGPKTGGNAALMSLREEEIS